MEGDILKPKHGLCCLDYSSTNWRKRLKQAASMTQADNKREIWRCPQGLSCSALLPEGHQSLEEGWSFKCKGMAQVWAWMQMGDPAVRAKNKGRDRSKNVENCCLRKLPTQLAVFCPSGEVCKTAQYLPWVCRPRVSPAPETTGLP